MSNIRRVTVKAKDNGEVSHVAAFFDSTAIHLIMWFPSLRDDSGRLYVSFSVGGDNAYIYDNVSYNVMNELMNAESVGRKFSEIVRGQYEYTKC